MTISARQFHTLFFCVVQNKVLWASIDTFAKNSGSWHGIFYLWCSVFTENLIANFPLILIPAIPFHGAVIPIPKINLIPKNVYLWMNIHHNPGTQPKPEEKKTILHLFLWASCSFIKNSYTGNLQSFRIKNLIHMKMLCYNIFNFDKIDFEFLCFFLSLSLKFYLF